MKASEARELSKEATAKSKQQLAFILDQVRSAASEEGEYSMSFVLAADARTVSALLALGYKVLEDTYRNARLLTVSWAEDGECLEQPRAVATQATSALAGGSGVVPAGGLRSAYIEYERAGQESGRKIVEQAAAIPSTLVVSRRYPSDRQPTYWCGDGPDAIGVANNWWTADVQHPSVRVLSVDEARALLVSLRSREESLARYSAVSRATLMDALL